MEMLKKGWDKDRDKIVHLLKTMEQDMKREDELEEELLTVRKNVQKMGAEVSGMLCPLEIGKLYRVKSNAMLDWTRVGGRHFRVVRYSIPRKKDDKWSVYVNWYNKKGEKFRVYGNEIIGSYISSDFAENIEVIP